jgi:RND family efflux transporter MFP subunit
MSFRGEGWSNMSRQYFAFACTCVVFCGLILLGREVISQEGRTDAKGALPVASAGDQVIVKKEATRVIEPHKYRVSLSIEPIQSVTLTAPFAGVVKQISSKPNAKVQAQSDLIRLDTTVPKLNVQRAEAAYKVAAAEQKLVADKDETQKALAQAKLDVAKAEVDLAKYYLEQTSIRAPFSGELQRNLVSDGQFVRAGDPVAVIIDVSKLRVEIPVERASLEAGKSFPLKIEDKEVDGKVDAVLPLHSRFDALRDLFESVASAVVIVDNPDGRLKPGQTVYVPLIPRQPVAEVPNASIGNLPDGQRKVQVVRQMTVRDVPVVLMGAIGSNRTFVNGPFAEGDEVIYESSHQLGDAFQLKPSVAAASAATGQGNTSPTGAAPPGATTKSRVGF